MDAEQPRGTWAQWRPPHYGAEIADFDETSPLLGWRVVYVIDGPRLASLLAGREPPEKLIAPLGKPFTARCQWTGEDAPCTIARSRFPCYKACGIYGLATPRLHHSVATEGTRAFGIWKFTGTVSVLGGTIRAQHATPLELELRDVEPPIDQAVAIADAYGIRAWALANDEPLDLSRFELAPAKAAA